MPAAGRDRPELGPRTEARRAAALASPACRGELWVGPGLGGTHRWRRSAGEAGDLAAFFILGD